jgi:type IV secretory pathway VirB10-like protein
VLERLGQRFPQLASSSPNFPAAATPPRLWPALRATGASGAALGAGLVLAGFIAGYVAKPERSIPREPPERRAASSIAADEAGSAKPPQQPLESERTEEARAAPEPAPVVDGAQQPQREHPARSASRAAAGDSRADPRRQLEQELLALQRAERALRNDSAELALALLAELDLQHPRALLGEERSATRIMASCQAGKEDATIAAERFLEGHPRSVYGDRIRAACRLESDRQKSRGAATDAAARDIDGR